MKKTQFTILVASLPLILTADLSAVSLIEKSPFIPSGWNERSEDGNDLGSDAVDLKFMGVYRIGPTYRFNLKSGHDGKSTWSTLYGKVAGVELLAYDVTTDELTIRKNGRTVVLKLNGDSLRTNNSGLPALVGVYQQQPTDGPVAVVNESNEVGAATVNRRMRATANGQSRRGGFLNHKVKRLLSDRNTVRNPLGEADRKSQSPSGPELPESGDGHLAPRNALQDLLP